MAKRGHELLGEERDAPRETEDEADEDELPPPPEVWHLTTKEQWHQLLEVYKTKVRPEGPGPAKRLRGIPDRRAMIAELERLADEASAAEAESEIVLHISIVHHDDILSSTTLHYLLVSTPTVVSKLKTIASYGSINIDVEANANVTWHDGKGVKPKSTDGEQVMLELCKTLLAVYLNDNQHWQHYPALPGIDVVNVFYVMGY
jgi:hypothetical protein